jgi:hypothetical protein
VVFLLNLHPQLLVVELTSLLFLALDKFLFLVVTITNLLIIIYLLLHPLGYFLAMRARYLLLVLVLSFPLHLLNRPLPILLRRIVISNSPQRLIIVFDPIDLHFSVCHLFL